MKLFLVGLFLAPAVTFCSADPTFLVPEIAQRVHWNSCFALKQVVARGLLNLSNKMAATPPELSTCPFCGSSFKRLGSHLSLCKKREGRAYQHFLSAKTLAKKTKSKKKACPVCNKQFSRLDTHLRLRLHPLNPPTPFLQLRHSYLH